MPSPMDILFDPTSLIIIGLFASCILLETFFPGRKLPAVKGWKVRALSSFILFFYLSAYLPIFWDQYLIPYQLIDLSQLGFWPSLMISLLVFELLIYIWHRSIHNVDGLWRAFHQMHHSAERIDAYGAFYYSPLDIAGFTMVGSLSLTLIAGLTPEATSLFLYITTFLLAFQHMNVKTPRWIGYFIQRPESHTIHHKKGVHAYNYSDFPLYDILFGTFKNPKDFELETGFYDGASAKVGPMLLWRDINAPKT